MNDFLCPAGMPIDLVLFGNSQTAQETRRLIQQVAITDLPLLLEGESGTGKETAARWIHAQSPFSQGNFVRLSSSALSIAEIEESESNFSCLSAIPSFEIEEALKGTLFLDEVEELSPTCQSRLLAILQDRKFINPITSDGSAKDGRIISSARIGTNHIEVKAALRPEFYYSVNAVTFRMPPLRERIDELPALAEHFVAQMANEFHMTIRPLSSSAIKTMVEYAWPGNLRELRDIVTSYVLTGSEEMLIKKLTTTDGSSKIQAA
ncbi:MAG: sigma-54-dependent Fis family transcriptional regulator [Acidobacteria bacterium]|nr:sigma-54-dependent Fis family transcriptional regulator [Acidobacteriota bacterium]